MSRVCQVTGKEPMKGHLVSHANNKTIRNFQPNLHYRRFWVETQNRWYTIVNRGSGCALISGHPKFCPQPVPVRIAGSTWGGSLVPTPRRPSATPVMPTA